MATKAGKAKKAEQPEKAADKGEAFTHKRGMADTRGDVPGFPPGARLDAPAREVQS